MLAGLKCHTDAITYYWIRKKSWHLINDIKLFRFCLNLAACLYFKSNVEHIGCDKCMQTCHQIH